MNEYHIDVRLVDIPDKYKAIEKRHRDILILMAEGYTQDDISIKLDRSVATVKREVRWLYDRFGANNPPHLVKIAYDAGIIGNNGNNGNHSYKTLAV